MKWYIALNETSLTGSRALWEPMITAALSSARRYTSLRPHLIYDGGEDPFLDRIEAEGVVIVRHRVSFYDALAAHPSEDERYLKIAHGAFLRAEIPLVETEDEFVLYTDCDVLFEREVDLSHVRPALFACAPEFNKEDMARFNTGVMVMNVPALNEDLPRFISFIHANLGKFDTFDQDAYRQFYGDQVDRLPLEYNWRPYWGRSDEAAIIHFHGPKPTWAQILLQDLEAAKGMVLGDHVHWNVEGYRHYVPRWLDAASL